MKKKSNTHKVVQTEVTKALDKAFRDTGIDPSETSWCCADLENKTKTESPQPMLHYSHNFEAFASALRSRFEQLSKGELYVTDIRKSVLYEEYQSAYPEGTNDIFRTRRHFDGAYDRSVLNQIGGLVSLADGKRTTIWDIPDLEYPFDVMAKTMHELVMGLPIRGIYRTSFPSFGTVSSEEKSEAGTIVWYHLNVGISARHVSNTPTKDMATAKESVTLCTRALKDITEDSVDTVLKMVKGKDGYQRLYRGSQNLAIVESFKEVIKNAKDIPSGKELTEHLFRTWSNPAYRIRNTAIGSLLVDLSSGAYPSHEDAVAAYTRKVDPANFMQSSKRASDSAKVSAINYIRDNGLGESMYRRFATLEDVSVNDVIWANRKSAEVMAGTLEAVLDVVPKAKAPKVIGKRTPKIGIEKFLKKVLPAAELVEVSHTPEQVKNLVSLTTAEVPDSPPLTSWGNSSAWSYYGEATDSSITARVKKAGGNTNAYLRVSLGWENTDDLDISAITPNGHVYFNNRLGVLDVDMNVHGESTTPVENLSWSNPDDGDYKVVVKNYMRRGEYRSGKDGFTLEMSVGGETTCYTYPSNLAHKAVVNAISFTVKKGKVTNLKVAGKLVQGLLPELKTTWGVTPNTFTPINTVMLSPNFWGDNNQGNKHWFFLTDQCVNPEPTRGMYNEFLREDLRVHRKVFQELSENMLCPKTDAQLSGFGFSSTIAEELLVRVTTGDKKQTYLVQFGE